MKPLSPLFTIQQISQKCDVPKSTLRFWEERLDPLFSPIRSLGGQRRYVQEHIDMIGRIRANVRNMFGLGVFGAVF